MQSNKRKASDDHEQRSFKSISDINFSILSYLEMVLFTDELFLYDAANISTEHVTAGNK
jgi:hypothetical protein